MYKIYQLENHEANVLDYIIGIYKIPLEIIQNDDCATSDYFIDLESGEPLDLVSGIYDILDHINCDNRALFNDRLEEGDKKCFFELCKELGIQTKSTEQTLKIQLPDERFVLVATVQETMPNHKELDVVIEDKDGCVVQDVVRVEPTISKMDMDNTEHDQDVVTVYLYEDEFDEDYTQKKVIGIYKEDYETNY